MQLNALNWLEKMRHFLFLKFVWFSSSRCTLWKCWCNFRLDGIENRLIQQHRSHQSYGIASTKCIYFAAGFFFSDWTFSLNAPFPIKFQSVSKWTETLHRNCDGLDSIVVANSAIIDGDSSKIFQFVCFNECWIFAPNLKSTKPSAKTHTLFRLQHSNVNCLLKIPHFLFLKDNLHSSKIIDFLSNRISANAEVWFSFLGQIFMC